MAGRGPRPKDPDKLAGGHAKARQAGMRVFTAEPVPQPPLPEGIAWPEQTLRWWANWGAEPMAAEFRPTDWDFMIDTAFLHARVWGRGEVKLLPEIRLRVAKMGATGEDRARLRITYAQADQAEDKRDRKSGAAAVAARYDKLRAVD